MSDCNSFDYERILYIAENGATVTANYAEESKEEFENLEAAKNLANLGKSVQLIPAMNSRKTADALIDGEFWEIKTNNKPTKSAIDHSFHKAKTQAKKIILNVKSDISEDELWRGIKGRIFRTQIEEFIIIRNNDVKHFIVKNKMIFELT